MERRRHATRYETEDRLLRARVDLTSDSLNASLLTQEARASRFTQEDCPRGSSRRIAQPHQ